MADPVYATSADVLSNFELEDDVTNEQVTDALLHADDRVNSRLQSASISTPQDPAIYLSLKLGAVAYARAELRRLVTGTTGPGLGIRRIREGDTEYEFITPDKVGASGNKEGDDHIEEAIIAILGGGLYFKTAEMNARADGRDL